MDINDVMVLAFVGLIVAAVASVAVSAARQRRRAGAGKSQAKPFDQRGDGYFKAMFPDLQPLFQPENAVRLVRDRKGRTKVGDGSSWKYPPGFGAAEARISLVNGREHVRLFDAAGVLLTEFDYQDLPDGGALRIGRGKLTVVIDVPTNPRVRYWHPEREFKWSRKKGWWFNTPVAERPVDSNDSGSSFSSDRSSSSSSGYGTVAAAAGAAALVSGAGGAFAGGGASEGWDDASAATDGGNAGATSY